MASSVSMRAAVLFVPWLVACGGPEATVVISNVAGAAVVAGEYEEDEITVTGTTDVLVSIVPADIDPCIVVDVRVCKETPVEGGGITCDTSAGWFGTDYDVKASVNSFCDDELLVWWTTEAGSGTVELDDDDVHLTFTGRIGPSTAAMGEFDLSVDATLDTDDVETP